MDRDSITEDQAMFLAEAAWHDELFDPMDDVEEYPEFD